MNERIEKIINYLRKINFIIIPFEFTYLNHCTSFIPMDIKREWKIENIYVIGQSYQLMNL